VTPDDPAALALQEEAETRGFIVAWAPIELPAAVRERYDAWIDARHHATMGELARAIEVRQDPRPRFGWAKSVLVLAAPHAFPDPGTPANGFRIGRVARVFWIREQDWVQRLVQPHLEELKALCHELGGRCRDYVDQGPLPLRSHAANAGLGSIGRNGMLIRPGLGSYLTLAVLLTSFEVEAASPERDVCGRCVKCVRRCPTGALLGDGTLDANRCTSYWTTQHPGLVPQNVWSGIGDWVFGCDLCQEVCPWNARAERFWKGYEPEPELAHPDLRDFFSAYGTSFGEKYGESSFERAGRGRMARNALIVARNTNEGDALTLGRLGAEDVDPLVRATAAQALAGLGDTRTTERLLEDPAPAVRREAEAALHSR
jgi:epoxyqueuosine reductase